MINNDDDASFPDFVPAPPPTQPEPEQEEEQDEEMDRGCEDGMTFHSEMTGDEIPPCQREDVYVEPVKKEKLKKEDMFISTPSSQKIKKIINTEEPEVVPVKKPRKKRVMTDEAKAKLAIARAKGLETRKRNAELRKQAKLEKQQEKEIVKAVRKKRVAKLKKELDEPEQEEVIKREEPKKVQFVEKVVERGYTQDDMNKAISKALEVNETARKARKAEKKKRQAEEQHQKKIFNTVSKAVNPHDAWNFCFE